MPIDDSMGHPEVDCSIAVRDTIKVTASLRRVRLCFDEVAIPETLDNIRHRKLGAEAVSSQGGVRRALPATAPLVHTVHIKVVE